MRVWLAGLLAAHPRYAAWTDEERAIEARGKAAEAGAAPRLALARLYEALDRRGDALTTLEAAGKAAPSAEEHAEIERARLRTLRVQKRWDALDAALGQAAGVDDLVADVLAERAYLLVARKQYDEARRLLRTEVHAHAGSARAADLHFALGVANWFLGDRDWARFHWMWIVHERPDDRLAMRAKIAGVAEIMPYPNPELGGFEAQGQIGPQHIEEEHRASCALYAQRRPFFDKRDWDGPDRQSDASSDAPRDLVRRLRDGNAHRVANNEIVEKLVAAGEPALDALVEVLADEHYLGRGYASLALGRVMAAVDKRPLEAQKALVRGLQSTSPYVSALTSSGMKAAQLTWDDLADARTAVQADDAATHKAKQEPVPWEGDDAAVLVRRLRDGNSHRVTNNRIVERLVALGEPALAPLIVAIQDEGFAGRGYAAWALAKVLEPMKERPADAIAALEEVAASSQGYVQALSRSGLRTLGR